MKPHEGQSAHNPELAEGPYRSIDLARGTDEVLYPPLEAEDYSAQAEDIFRTIVDKNKKVSRGDAYRAAREAYVDEEEHPELKQFGDTLLRAPFVYQLDNKLKGLRSSRSDRLATGRKLSQDAQEQEDTGIRECTRAVCEYNHRLRDLLIQTEGKVPVETVTSWVQRSVGGNHVNVAKQMSGIVGEIAAYKMLEANPHVEDVRYGNVDEDLRGCDLMITLKSGRIFSGDVKVGNQRPEGNMKMMGRQRLEIGIPTGSIDERSLTPEAQAGLQTQFNDLMGSRIGV